MVQHAGLDIVDSYVSLSEVSEYAAQMPEEMKKPRLYPTIPPNHVDYAMPAWCFYPMSKKREGDANWFTLAVRTTQRVDARARRQRSQVRRSGRPVHHRHRPASTTSSGVSRCSPCVPTTSKRWSTRCGSTRRRPIYAEFGPFYTGMVTPVEELMAAADRDLHGDRCRSCSRGRSRRSRTTRNRPRTGRRWRPASACPPGPS